MKHTLVSSAIGAIRACQPPAPPAAPILFSFALHRRRRRVLDLEPVAYAAGVVSTGLAHLTGKEPRAPLDGVRMARKKMWVRHDKAARELGYAPGPAAGALRQAVDWFKANGYL